MSKIGEGIIRGLEQALAFVDGTADESQYVVHIPPEINMRAIRGRLGLTLQQFSDRYGFDLDTLRRWEQCRLVPVGSARAFLTVLGHETEVVHRALGIA